MLRTCTRLKFSLALGIPLEAVVARRALEYIDTLHILLAWNHRIEEKRENINLHALYHYSVFRYQSDSSFFFVMSIRHFSKEKELSRVNFRKDFWDGH